MKIAGRFDEIDILQQTLTIDQSEFVAMYGRRRIGKTYLLTEVYNKHMVFESAGLLNGITEFQLENFALSFPVAFQKKYIKQPFASWLVAFSTLKKYIQSLSNKNKKVIFLDEVPWFDTQRSGFLSALDNFWNTFCTRRKDIVLVICGSAASWIIDKVVNHKGGLHNRITTAINLKPFTLAETKEYLKLKKIKLVDKDIIGLYMVLGGVPFYYKDIKAGNSLPQIIDQLCFKNNSPLLTEFDKLYASLFNKAEIHIAIVETLSKSLQGFTRQQLIKKSNLPSGGRFTKVINELVQCGFVAAIQPIHKLKVETIYRLQDEFTLFYFKFMQQHVTKNTFQKIASTPAYKIWSGYAFENICIKHLQDIKQSLGINGIVVNHFSWVFKGNAQENGAQIDLLLDRDDNCINICEIKFYDSPYTITKQYANQLMIKKDLYRRTTKTKKNLFTTMITINGLVNNAQKLSVIDNELKADIFF